VALDHDVTVFRHQMLVVGGGLAGLRAAVEAKLAGIDVAVLSQVHPGRSHSGAAQGGINAALANNPDGHDDTPEKHAFDTVKGSDYLADQPAAMQMCQDAPGRIYEMEHWGCPFSRYDDGRITQRPFGGAGYPRTCYGADKTGHYLLHTLVERSYKLGIKLYVEWFVSRLIVEDGRCVGVVAYDMTGSAGSSGRAASGGAGSAADAGFHAFLGEVVVIATGGAGRIYSNTTNSLISTGGGAALAYHAGVPLKDMEFIQFHPTGLRTTNILMTEGCRGEGGYLVNDNGERFMERYAPKAMELAPRDITARAIWTEILEGRGIGGEPYVYLDLRHLGEAKIAERLPGIRDLAIHFEGVDPVTEPIPIVPSQHYTMGGIDTDVDGRTPLPGLYAAGECACVTVHGANRLGGNSLLETIVFGRRAGARAVADIQSGEAGAAVDLAEGSGAPARAVAAMVARVEALAANGEAGSGEDPYAIRDAMTTIMKDKFGIFRDAATMQEGLDALLALKERIPRLHLKYAGGPFNLDMIRTTELEGMLDLAITTACGALARTESRGSHARTDFPTRNDADWLKHTLAHYRPDEAQPALDYRAVELGLFEPQERKY
jgi:succinate dehydrogenase / fumarate reductase flavoprotein subunit